MKALLALAAAAALAAPAAAELPQNCLAAAPAALPQNTLCDCASTGVCTCAPGACQCPNCPAHPAKPAEPPGRPAGDGWQYDTARGVWWRPLPQPQVAYYWQPQPMMSFGGFGGGGGGCRGGG